MERKGTEWLPVVEEAPGQLRRDVLSVSRRTTVSAHEERTPRRHRPGNDCHHAIHVRSQGAERGRSAKVLLPHRLDGALMAHFNVHVRTPGSTNVRLTSWLSALRSAYCTA